MIPKAELNDLLRRLEDLYVHLATNRRHLHTLENRAEDLKNDILALVPPEEEPTEAEVEAPEEAEVEAPEEAEVEAPEEEEG